MELRRERICLQSRNDCFSVRFDGLGRLLKAPHFLVLVCSVVEKCANQLLRFPDSVKYAKLLNVRCIPRRFLQLPSLFFIFSSCKQILTLISPCDALGIRYIKTLNQTEA